MDRRSLFIGLGVLVAGVFLGVVLTLAFGSRRAGPVVEVPPAEVAAPRAPSTVQIGNPDPPPPLEVPELTALNQLFRGVAQRITPAVVFIEVQGPADARTREFEELHPFLQPRRFRRSAGSGVIISRDGYVVTNAHVIAGAERIHVLLNDRRQFEAEVVGVDPTTDLAVIRLPDAGDLPVATIGDSRTLEVGDWVVAVGNPFRLTSTVTAGIVSALGRQVDIIDDEYRIEDFIQTDAAINPGNSGGALVDLQGRLVGIATAIATEGGSYEGYGFAVPSNLMVRVVTDLIEYGEVRRGFLGVQITAVTADVARRAGLERIAGVVVQEVSRPAAEAGLRAGDIVLAVDGEEIDRLSQFQTAVAQRRPGETVRLTVWRRGGTREIEARLMGRDEAAFRAWAAESAPRPAPAPRPRRAPEAPPPRPEEPTLLELDRWGIGLRDLTADDRRRFGIEAGAYVVFVRPGGPASADGLPPHTVITEIEGETVTSAVMAGMLLERVARQADAALVRVRRQDGLTAFYDLETPSLE